MHLGTIRLLRCSLVTNLTVCPVHLLIDEANNEQLSNSTHEFLI